MEQTSSYEHFHVSSLDPEILSEKISNPRCVVRYSPLQVGGGFDDSVSINTLESLMTLQSTSQHGYRVRVEKEALDRLELHFVEQGQYHFEIGERSVNAGDVCLLRDFDELRIVCAPKTSHICVAVPVDRCIRLFAADVDDPHGELAGFSTAARFDDGALNTLHGIASLLCGDRISEDTLPRNSLGASLLEEAFLAAFVENWPKDTSRALSSKHSPDHVRRAVDWIEAHAGQRIQLEDLARAAGINVRTLQSGFRDVYGISPVAYILKTRLQRVHHGLLNAAPDVAISEIAARWGFTHMSDFARRYRQMFGRTPSETRSRASGIR